MFRNALPAIVTLIFLLSSFSGCAALRPSASDSGGSWAKAARPAPGRVSKEISFSILEDYDRGEDLHEVARDFELMRELEIDTWRGSFGWDDYEPARGEYDFAWLHQFADLAERDGIKLRPYIGYTPAWAARGGSDGKAWNDPPKNPADWYGFVYRLVTEMRRHRNILSYEIYNEENVPQWWEGTVAEYNQILLTGAAAVRRADPDAAVLLGGLVFPDLEFIEEICTDFGNAGSFDVVSLHAYPETWTPAGVTVENYLGEIYRKFSGAVDARCEGEPIWINEAGYPTSEGRTEQDQANWWARAIATFLALPEVAHIGIYEIKDLKPERDVIGDPENYMLGLTRSDRTKKLAFETIDLLTDLLDVSPLTVADADLKVTVLEGVAGALHHHLFIRPDGRQVLLIWDKSGSSTLDLRMAERGAAAVEYGLDGRATAYGPFDGERLRNVRLIPGIVRIFEIRP
jgi:hypothetical protein